MYPQMHLLAKLAVLYNNNNQYEIAHIVLCVYVASYPDLPMFFNECM